MSARSPAFEDPATRRTLLEIFERNLGDPTFTVDSLGLWASFLDGLGLDPTEFSAITHRLVECGFLNVAFSGDDIDLDRLDHRLDAGVDDDADCLAIPCVRATEHEPLTSRGFTPVPAFHNCVAQLEGPDWHHHLRSLRGGKRYRGIRRQMRRLGRAYATEWRSMAALVDDEPLAARASAIYLANARHFEHPAIHFPLPVMRDIVDAGLGEHFQVALTRRQGELVKVIVCFLDVDAGYIAFLVQGIDHDAVPDRHNLYKHAYITVYERMEELGLRTFDMARGYVTDKGRLGANVVEPLHVYLRPQTDRAAAYVRTVATLAEQATLPESAREFV